MTLKALSLATLAEIDEGRIRTAFEQAMNRAQSDCADRPGVKSARSVTLKVVLTPIPDEDTGALDSCQVQFQFSESIPKRGSKPYNMRAKGAALLFNDLSPEDAKQRTLDEVEAQTPKLKAVRDAQ